MQGVQVASAARPLHVRRSRHLVAFRPLLPRAAAGASACLFRHEPLPGCAVVTLTCARASCYRDGLQARLDTQAAALSALCRSGAVGVGVGVGHEAMRPCGHEALATRSPRTMLCSRRAVMREATQLAACARPPPPLLAPEHRSASGGMRPTCRLPAICAAPAADASMRQQHFPPATAGSSASARSQPTTAARCPRRCQPRQRRWGTSAPTAMLFFYGPHLVLLFLLCHPAAAWPARRCTSPSRSAVAPASSPPARWSASAPGPRCA